MQVLDSIPPNAAGGACFLNRANYRGRCIDTGVVNDFDTPLPYGKIVVSESTAAHMADLLGWVSPEKAQELTDRIDDLEAVLAGVVEERDRALEAVVALRRLEEPVG